MKSLMLGLMIVATILTACGKKGGKGGGGAAAPGAAAGACGLDAFGRCVGGTGQSGDVPVNTWQGRVSVTDMNRYRQFLADNGLCYAQSCQGIVGFFDLAVQTIRDPNFGAGPSNFARLPGWVNFAVRPQTYYYRTRGLETRGEGRITGANNGFEVIYTPNNGGFFGGPMPYGYGYGYPQQPIAPQQNRTLQIVVTWADATQTIANATVLYQGAQFANGRVYGRFYAGPNSQMVNGVPQNQNVQGGPAVAPYQQPQYQQQPAW